MPESLQLVAIQAGVGGPWRLPEAGLGQFSIGRKACCQLNLPEAYAYVSGEHCRLKTVFRDGQRITTLEDLSGNGTFINGVRVGRGKSETVKVGDEISLAKPTRKGGAVMFRMEACEAPKPAFVNPAEATTVMPDPPLVAPPPAAEVQAASVPTAAHAALSAAMARQACQRQEESQQLEARIAAEKARCGELEAELQEAKRCLQDERRKASSRHPAARSLRPLSSNSAEGDCEELRAALRRVAEEQRPLEKARLEAEEATRRDRQQCERLRAELQEEQRVAETSAAEALRLRSEVQEATSRASAMEASVQRETEVNAALEEQCAAACTEWGRSKDAVSAARKRLEERGAAYKALRLAVWDYHQKVSRRLSALEQALLEAPSGDSSTMADAAQLRGTRGADASRAEGVLGGAAVHVGSSMDDETPTQDADAAAGAAPGICRSQGSQPEAKRPRL
ncbi:fhkA [Symbiodinium sp. CCMP2456]|nr:fhkA [Symbiodinium sp. CCMP2456]